MATVTARRDAGYFAENNNWGRVIYNLNSTPLKQETTLNISYFKAKWVERNMADTRRRRDVCNAFTVSSNSKCN